MSLVAALSSCGTSIEVYLGLLPDSCTITSRFVATSKNPSCISQSPAGSRRYCLSNICTIDKVEGQICMFPYLSNG